MEAVHLGERILLRISDLVHYEECYKMKEDIYVRIRKKSTIKS
jgi:hypothetical protein